VPQGDEYGQEYTDQQAGRSRLRKVLRRPWLRAAAAFVEGPSIDLGCGVGELLERLPAGSVGLEINEASVEHCRAKGLDVTYYDGWTDDWQLSAVRGDDVRYDTLIISHVLEHFDEPIDVLHRLLATGGPLGLRQVLIVVPGKAGFRSQETHRTYVDRTMLSDAEVTRGTGFALTSTSYFPGNLGMIGDVFTYHELRASYLRL
jgi:SAM-dependent methyltransferase